MGKTANEAVNLSPMAFEHIDYNGRVLVLDPPLTITPFLEEDFYVLTEDSLGLYVFAQTREQLAAEVAEQLVFSWDTYALEDPERLTASARQLRDALRRRAREVA